MRLAFVGISLVSNEPFNYEFNFLLETAFGKI
jgi:hypothetical protein